MFIAGFRNIMKVIRLCCDTERLLLGAWEKVYAKKMGSFWIRKRVGTNTYELDLPSDMTIGLVFIVKDLTPHGPGDISPFSSPDISSHPSSPPVIVPTSSSPIEPISAPPVLVPPSCTPLYFFTADN